MSRMWLALIWFAPTVLGLIVLTFTISHIIPADPIAYIAGENASNEALAELRHEYGFDLPIHVQLYNYVIGVLNGEFGVSLYTHRPIVNDLLARLPATLELTFVAVLLSTVIGIPLGVISAVYRNSLLDHALKRPVVQGFGIDYHAIEIEDHGLEHGASVNRLATAAKPAITRRRALLH